MNSIKLIILSLVVVWLTGCASTAVAPAYGGFYTKEKFPVLVGDNSSTAKKGEACAESVLGFANGDASLEAAKRDGNITQVTTVDGRSKSILGFYAKYCTVVYGK